ncbi:hypothetical protein [Streptomyces sp. NBC_01615]|uniref:hypothetical protein n=1 Tax=Streptomyces sp. NBC_01615 TaxID=2975898 RepID=UPI00386F3003
MAYAAAAELKGQDRETEVPCPSNETVGKAQVVTMERDIPNAAYIAVGRGIWCQGRGSAASSVVCSVLSITAVDALKHGLLFERFLSMEKAGPPDIDIDFENARREEVIQYLTDSAVSVDVTRRGGL